MDSYSSYRELAARHVEGVDYIIVVERRASPIAIVAPHGGGIELGTSEIARAVAGADFSLYSFEGFEAEGNGVLHLTSTRFDEPRAVELVARSDIVVTIHGCEDREPLVFVGGLDAALRTRFIESLQDAGFDARADNSHHAGNSPRNLCNRGQRGEGVQFEVSRGLRRQLFAGMRGKARAQTTEEFSRFTESLRGVLLDAGDRRER